MSCGPDHMQMPTPSRIAHPRNRQGFLCTGRPVTKLSRVNNSLGHFLSVRHYFESGKVGDVILLRLKVALTLLLAGPP